MDGPTKTQLPQPYAGSSAAKSALALELAKMLVLVAPITMTTEQRETWLLGAVDALEDIRVEEIRAISAELRRTITRLNQVVPEIAKLVAEKRARASRVASAPTSREWEIDQEASARRSKARGREELNACWEWERQARIDAGLHVAPRPKPLSRDELETMLPHIRQLGLSSGFLEYRDGKVCEVR
jgi:hypothetical protein